MLAVSTVDAVADELCDGADDSVENAETLLEMDVTGEIWAGDTWVPPTGRLGIAMVMFFCGNGGSTGREEVGGGAGATAAMVRAACGSDCGSDFGSDCGVDVDGACCVVGGGVVVGRCFRGVGGRCCGRLDPEGGEEGATRGGAGRALEKRDFPPFVDPARCDAVSIVEVFWRGDCKEWTENDS